MIKVLTSFGCHGPHKVQTMVSQSITRLETTIHLSTIENVSNKYDIQNIVHVTFLYL